MSPTLSPVPLAGSVAIDEPPALLYDRARALETDGAIEPAILGYRQAVAGAEVRKDAAILATALCRLAILLHHANQSPEARALAERSRAVAEAAGDLLRAAEAVNVQAGIALELGEFDLAKELYSRAAVLGANEPSVLGRVAQNLGIIANVRGEWGDARAHYDQALAAFEGSGDEQRAAIAYHNLGLVHSHGGDLGAAEYNLKKSRTIAQRLGDLRLEGLASLNLAEVHDETGRSEEAQVEVETALGIFNQLGSERDKADAYRVLGTLYRRRGRTTLAEARLTQAVRMATATGSALSEAEAAEELALLYQDMGRNQDAVRNLTVAHRLYTRLAAAPGLTSVKRNVQTLENTYLSVVREWGQSIESSDSYTYLHCERVANYGAVVAEALQVDDQAARAIQFGAYLHDLGKVKVPHEILNKAGKLTDDEFAIIKNHPAWGVELLADIDFPWDIVPIIRWHHERLDGGGYPDRLAGDAIPLNAQIICVVDVWDALRTRRSYREAFPVDRAVAVMEDSRHWWRPDVFEAFKATVPSF